MITLHKFTSANQACAAHVNYMRALLYDYEIYVNHFHHIISLNDFVKGWTIITPEDFQLLQPGDKIWDVANELTVVEPPWTSMGADDEDVWTVEVQDKQGSTYYIEEGCAWSTPNCHEDYEWRKKYQEEEKEWPTLIIRKKERQS